MYIYQNFGFVFGEPVESNISERYSILRSTFFLKIISKCTPKPGHPRTAPLLQFQQDN